MLLQKDSFPVKISYQIKISVTLYVFINILETFFNHRKSRNFLYIFRKYSARTQLALELFTVYCRVELPKTCVLQSERFYELLRNEAPLPFAHVPCMHLQMKTFLFHIIIILFCYLKIYVVNKNSCNAVSLNWQGTTCLELQ